MNKAYEKLSRILGSTAMIFGFLAWLIYHSISSWEYLSFISELAILFGLMILRGQMAGADRLEVYMKKDLNESKKILKEVE